MSFCTTLFYLSLFLLPLDECRKLRRRHYFICAGLQKARNTKRRVKTNMFDLYLTFYGDIFNKK